MSITIVGAVKATATDGNNATIDISSLSPQTDDLVFIASGTASRSSNEGRIGNSLSYTQDINLTSAQRFRTAYKKYISGETSITIEGSGNASDALVAVAILLRGQDTTTPIDVTSTTAGGNSTNPDCPSITPSSNDCCILAITNSTVVDASITAPTNYTIPTNGTANASDTNSYTIAIAYRILSGGGGSAENPSSYTNWSSSVWQAATTAIRPAPSLSVTHRMFAVF